MILIIFTVNSIEFAYFFKSWEAATACASSRGVGFALRTLLKTVLVSACRAIYLSVAFMSATV